MIKVYPYDQLGGENHGWLDAKHHFSFAGYYNPDRMGFGVLRVINDDTIQAKKGFDIHPHKNMEIITYVREGAITHRDDRGNEGRTIKGDVQVMSAGSGIHHSEYNLEDESTKIYQIWIKPNKLNVQPSWDSHSFPKDLVNNELNLLVSGDGAAPLHIHQDAFIYAGRLAVNTEINHSIHHQAYVLVSEGEVAINGSSLKAGDGAEVIAENTINIKALTESEILVIDVPSNG